MLRRNLFIVGLAVDQLNRNVFRAELVHAHPGVDIDAFAQAELTIAASIHIELDAMPALPDVLLPAREDPCPFVVVRANVHTLLDIGYVVACRILFYHTAHTELWHAGADRILHSADPMMWYIVAAVLEERRNKFL